MGNELRKLIRRNNSVELKLEGLINRSGELKLRIASIKGINSGELKLRRSIRVS